MQVIPVIDVRGGVAVRAVAGERSAYQPLETPLADGCDPAAIAHGANGEMQRRIAEAWAGSAVWIDDGGLGGEPMVGKVCRVTGSESLLASGVCQMMPGGRSAGRAFCRSTSGVMPSSGRRSFWQRRSCGRGR